MNKKQEVQVQPVDYGLDSKQATELIGNLPVVKSEREILINQFNEVILLDIEDANTSKQARELRLKIQKNRTQGINKWHKEAKDMFLRGGQFVDAVKRFEASVNESMESRLEEIEKYAEIKEQKRISELKEKRIKELEIYSEFVPFGIDLGILSDDEFTKLFNGAKLQYEANQERLRIEEENRANEERRTRLHNDRKDQVLRYYQFLEESEKFLNFGDFSEEDFGVFIEKLKEKQEVFNIKQIEIQKENERLLKEKMEAEKIAFEEKKRKDAIIEKEREKQRALQAELQAKKDEEARMLKLKLEEEEKSRKEAEELAKAPIKKQMLSWIDSFSIPVTGIENDKVVEIICKFESFKKWAIKQIDNL